MRNRSKVQRATLAAMVAAALVMGVGEAGAAARKSAADSRASTGARAKFVERVTSLAAALATYLVPPVLEVDPGDGRIWRMPVTPTPRQE